MFEATCDEETGRPVRMRGPTAHRREVIAGGRQRTGKWTKFVQKTLQRGAENWKFCLSPMLQEEE